MGGIAQPNNSDIFNEDILRIKIAGKENHKYTTRP
jgi:hypothetical protein